MSPETPPLSVSPMTPGEISGLRGLVERATQEDLTDEGRYFADSFDDLTRCRHEEIGEYQNRHDGPLVEWLWNHRHQIAEMVVVLDAQQARIAALTEALRPFHLAIHDDVPDDKLIATVAHSAGDYRRVAALVEGA